MIRHHEIAPILPEGVILPEARVRSFLDRYPLPAKIGLGWHSLDPDYARELLALLYASSAETPVLKHLFTQRIIPGVAGRKGALDIGSGSGRLVEIFKGFEQVRLIERDEHSLQMLQRTVDRLDIPAEVVNIDYGTIKMTEHPCDLKTFTHSIYYFEGNWATLAREAFSTIRPGGSLVFTLNGDEGGSAAMIDHLSHLGYSGLSKLDISGFIDSCAAMEGISLAVYRVPLKIPNQHDSEFLVHMARIFLEDLRTPIDSDAVRAYLKMTKNQLDFVDKVIELKPETGHARTEPDD